MRKSVWVVVLIVVVLNLLGVAMALLTPTTGDGMGDALEAHFRFVAPSLVGLVVNVVFLLFVVVRWGKFRKSERATAFMLLCTPVLAYLLLILLGAVF